MRQPAPPAERLNAPAPPSARSRRLRLLPTGRSPSEPEQRGSSLRRAMSAFSAALAGGFLLYLLMLSSRPTFARLTPVPGTTAPPGQVTIGAQITAPRPIQVVTLSIDGREMQPIVEAPSSQSWTVCYLAVLPKGRHEVAVTVRDEAGTERRQSWTFAASGPRVVPDIVAVGPPDGSILTGGTARVSARLISGSAIGNVVLTLNGVDIPARVEPASRTLGAGDLLAWQIAADQALAPGQYMSSLHVTDDDGETTSETWAFTVSDDAGQATARYFAETGVYVQDPFKSFWESKDGAKTFGNPVSPQFVDPTGRTVQYFEYARFELSPDGSVALGRIGPEVVAANTAPIENPNIDGALYFPETGHTVAGKFRAFWEQNGQVDILGFPITEPLEENGTRVQYFERARLQLVPSEDGTSTEIQRSPIGIDRWRAVSGPAAP